MNKFCPKCSQTKPMSEFHKNQYRYDGVAGWCKNCMSLVLKERYQEKKDLILEQCRSYRINNPEKRHATCQNYSFTHREQKRASGQRLYRADLEKSRLKSVVKHHKKRVNFTSAFTIEEWKLLCKQFNYCCADCGEKKPLTVDHIIPISKGGVNKIENIQPLCRECNSRKLDRVIDYRLKQNSVVAEAQ